MVCSFLGCGQVEGDAMAICQKSSDRQHGQLLKKISLGSPFWSGQEPQLYHVCGLISILYEHFALEISGVFLGGGPGFETSLVL